MAWVTSCVRSVVGRSVTWYLRFSSKYILIHSRSRTQVKTRLKGTHTHRHTRQISTPTRVLLTSRKETNWTTYRTESRQNFNVFMLTMSKILIYGNKGRKAREKRNEWIKNEITTVATLPTLMLLLITLWRGGKPESLREVVDSQPSLPLESPNRTAIGNTFLCHIYQWEDQKTTDEICLDL